MRFQFRLGFRNRLFNREVTREHTFRIRIDGGFLRIEGNRGNRARCICANAGQLSQRISRAWKLAAQLVRNDLRRRMHVPRSGVIAKPRPCSEHVVERCCRQRFHIRPAREEFAVIRSNRLHGRLLQHDLRQPHAIRISKLAALRPPWQVAPMLVIPGKQARGW
ncbi:MAG TPA: hypothetical protein VK779_12195 [Rhizomicrobium sp.]|nr:hypothetical protein [Rhizomicrobium sp.]